MTHKIREVYIVHHSHTDVGYTDLQEQVIYNQANNIRRAVELIENGIKNNTTQKDLKWNCETWYCVEQFLKVATEEEKKTFFDLVKKNSIGLSANYLNFNDLADCEYLTEKIHEMQEVCAEEGVTVKTAMFADINGISMGQRDAMLANGVEFLYTNIHTHHGMYPLYQNQKPYFWENEDGKRLLVWSGEHYTLGNALGIVFNKNVNFMTENYFGKAQGDVAGPLEKLHSNLIASMEEYEENGYPYDFYITSVSGVFSDNAPINPAIADTVALFNEKYGEEVTMRMVTLQELYDLIRDKVADAPVYRGAINDWWGNGVGSTPYAVKHYKEAVRLNRICDRLEEKTGVHMEYQPLSTSASAEQFNVMIASGAYPDLIGWGLNYTTGDDAAVEEEIYYDLTDYIAEYAPNYFNILATDDELLDTAVTDGGHIVGFHAVRTEQSLGKAGLAIRTDELEKLGLDKPYTIEEFENTLAAFKDDGLKQPLVMLAPGAIQDNWLAAAFNVAAFCNSFPMSVAPTYVEDGKIKFGPLGEGFKEYITLIHDWYEKGYIHSDFVSLNSNWNSPDYANAITSGDAGIFYADQGNLGGYNDASEIPGFSVEATYDMHATKDSINHFAQYTKKSVGNGFKITTNCENVELACRWGDWWYTDEGSLLANYGVEGVSFDYVDGKPVLNETVTDAPEGMRDALLIYASNDTICCVIDPTAVTSGYSDVDKAAPEIWNEGMDDTMVIPSTVTLSADENTRAANIYSDIETICLEAIAKFITGEKPLTEYDSFVESIQNAGIEDYLAIQQGAYDRAMAD